MYLCICSKKLAVFYVLFNFLALPLECNITAQRRKAVVLVISIVMHITTEATVQRWKLDNRGIHIYNAVRYWVSEKAHSQDCAPQIHPK